jgi:hypothetical protein
MLTLATVGWRPIVLPFLWHWGVHLTVPKPLPHDDFLRRSQEERDEQRILEGEMMVRTAEKAKNQAAYFGLLNLAMIATGVVGIVSVVVSWWRRKALAH